MVRPTRTRITTIMAIWTGVTAKEDEPKADMIKIALC
jgi:hypothetical protein